MTVEIRQHAIGRDLGDFIRAGHVVFAGDPNWVPPLELMLRDQLNPKNPFFEHGEGTLFTAWSMPVNLAIKVMKGQLYERYRVYEKALA